MIRTVGYSVHIHFSPGLHPQQVNKRVTKICAHQFVKYIDGPARSYPSEYYVLDNMVELIQKNRTHI